MPKWVSGWQGLRNPSLRESGSEPLDWLVGNHYAAADGTPTALAFRRGLAQNRNGKTLWNLTRVVSLRRQSRRNVR